MEVISNFGLNPMLLGAQVINFLIILYILKRFLYKPVLETLKKRQDSIKEGIKQAEEARVKLERVVIEEKNILTNAQMHSRKIMEDAEKESAEIIKKMNAQAKVRNDELLKDAKEQIAREYILTEKKLAANTSKLAVKILEKSLAEYFSSKDQKQIVSDVLKKIQKSK